LLEGLDLATAEAWIKEVNENIAFHSLLGIKIKEIGPDWATLSLVIQGNLTNFQNKTHGGVTMALADAAMGMAIRTRGKVGTTVEMNINFLEPISLNQELMAWGRVLRLGKTLAVCECDLLVLDKVVGKARGTFYLVGEKTS
jgi:uncharacterized protein (TIGR00369 family)